jgi:Na+/proline symporter
MVPAGAAGPSAPFFSDAALIGIGAAAVLAGVLVAVTSSSSSTTTTTSH